jgi:hypothetical protein
MSNLLLCIDSHCDATAGVLIDTLQMPVPRRDTPSLRNNEIDLEGHKLIG